MDRDHILAEIQRTTAENGGTPLGRSRFFAESGIAEHYSTRYWARWSEAVRDAGFESTNQFTEAIPRETLLEKLATLVRELGRFPVNRELKVKSLADPNFPSPETYRRLGNRHVLAERFREFATARGYHDVEALCPKALAQSAVPKSADRLKPVEMGCVYMMKSGKFYKIGRTNALGRRERELTIQPPDKVTIIHEIRTDDPAGIEDYWHRRFAERHRNGEWFDLTAEDVAAFRRRKMM
jgi:hypothetical protein